MFKYLNVFSFISDLLLKLSFGVIFFNYGYNKLLSLIYGGAEKLINMVASIPFFGKMPVFFAWILALSETCILFALIYGAFSFLPLSNFTTRIAGIFSLIISLVVAYMHIFIWGDNLFSNGPFEMLNASEGKKAIFGQFLFIPISIYIIFNNRLSYLPNENK